MPDKPWSIAQQQERRRQLNAIYLPFGLKHFDAQGTYVAEGDGTTAAGAGQDGGLRERCWHCLGLYSGDLEARELADTIMTTNPSYECGFSSTAAQQVFLRHRDVMSPEAREWVLNYLQEFAHRHCNANFNGHNDNTPAMATFTRLVHGEMFDDAELFQSGLDQLYILRDMLYRNGFLSEFVSPTYSPISVLSLALIANYVKHEEAVQLALDCEARVWAELVSHFHVPTAMLTGPSARSYMVDSSGGVSMARVLFHHVFGDVCFVNSINSLFPGPLEMEKHPSVPFMQCSSLWTADADYHVPDEVGAAMLERPLPDTVIGTRDGGEKTHDKYIRDPATNRFTAERLSPHRNATTHNPITTYLTENYSLGTSTHRYGTGGQSEILFATYPRCKPARRMQDVGTVFTRYIVNELKPGQTNYHAGQQKECQRTLLFSEGLSWAMQKDNFALCLSRPDGLYCEGIHSLKQAVIVPCLYGEPEEIWLGDRKLDGFVGQSEERVPVFIREGDIYMAITPLTHTEGNPTNHAVTLALENDYGVISFYNFQGPEKEFDREELIGIRGGFAFEIADKSEAGTFDAFRRQAADLELVDNVSVNVRHVRILHRGNDFHTIYSLHTEGIRCATINGKPLPEPKFETRAFDTGRLPFMDEEYISESLDWYRRVYPDN